MVVVLCLWCRGRADRCWMEKGARMGWEVSVYEQQALDRQGQRRSPPSWKPVETIRKKWGPGWAGFVVDDRPD